jgi:hypothetical protein
MTRTTKHRLTMIALISSLLLSSSFLVACGDDSDSSTTASQPTAATTVEPEYVVPGGAALSERQQDMVSMVEAYGAAWQATDGDGVASFMTADGYIEYPHDDTVFRVSDGTLQERVTNGPYDTLQTVAPMTVYDNWIVLSGRIDSMSLNWLSVVRFTPSGDVKTMSDTIFL